MGAATRQRVQPEMEQPMNKLEQAARQALEALETLDCGDSYKTHNAAAALRKALEVTEASISDHKSEQVMVCAAVIRARGEK